MSRRRISESDPCRLATRPAASKKPRIERLVPLDVAVRDGTPEDRMQSIVGAEAGSFVRFLIERFGRDKLGRVYASGARALQPTYGEPLAQLEREWREHLDGVSAAESLCEAVVKAAR